MDRRTDRTIGIAVIIAVALVPTAALALVKVGDGFDAGRPAEVAVSPAPEDYPGAPKPPPVPTKSPAVSVSLPQLPTGVDPSQPVGEVPEAKPLPAELSSFTRQIGMVLAQASGTTNSQETAKFTLKPRFTMDAKTTEYVLNAKGKWRKTGVTHVVIRNGVKATRTPDGELTKEKLTPEEIDQLKYEADPRTITNNAKNLPGIKKSYSRKTKFYKYTLDATTGATIIEKLPQDIRDLIPEEAGLLGLQLEVYADAKDHAFVASVTGAAPVAATGIGVVYSDMK
ncbi:hypothetical protein [Actinocorallia aurantiaca]|uniref:Outer membrane lipoprotein-sorting protein n=1 Tax=Actinocorallia aurantiaca TaxID=46204 RepID=A0ABN3UJW3_9ACTN